MQPRISLRIALVLVAPSVLIGFLLPCGANIMLAMVIASALGPESVEVLMKVGLIPIVIGPLAAGVVTSLLVARGIGMPCPATDAHSKPSRGVILLIGVGAWLLSNLLLVAWIRLTSYA